MEKAYSFFKGKFIPLIKGDVVIHPKVKFPRLILFLIVLALVLSSLVILVQFFTEPSVAPTNVQISNQSDSKLSVSYTTSKPTLSFAIASKDKWKLLIPYFNRYLGTVYLDENFTLSQNHHINFKNLSEGQGYYYVLSTGWHSYSSDSKNKSLPVATTLKEQTAKLVIPNPAYGKIIHKDKSVANGVLVYLRTKDKLLSTITDESGKWILDLSNTNLDKTVDVEVLNNTDSGKITLTSDHLQPALTLIIK